VHQLQDKTLSVAPCSHLVNHAFYPRDAMQARVIATATCLSVRHATVLCQNERHDSSPSGSPRILVFWCQISSQNSKGFPRAGSQRRVENSAIF